MACIVRALLEGRSGTKIAVHDFWKRRRYHSVLRLATVIDRADTMAVLQKRDCMSTLLARGLLARNLFNPN